MIASRLWSRLRVAGALAVRRGHGVALWLSRGGPEPIDVGGVARENVVAVRE